MHWMKYKFIYFSISALFIVMGVLALIFWGLKPGIDFTGGAIVELRISDSFSTEKLFQDLSSQNPKLISVQKSGEGNYLFKTAPIGREEKEKLKEDLKTNTNSDIEELRFENVGPSIGPELLRKTITAVIISACAILLWVAFQFKSLKFGTSAVLAMLHDSLILTGSFAVFGHFWGAEVDFMFVTALLTTLSFSVHDTIVVYDRIRETYKKTTGEVSQIADKAISETMVRSLNNSFTIIFMLLALVLLGGSTVKWFSLALLIGTVSGTYSSPFVAVPILVLWDETVKKVRQRGGLRKLFNFGK